MAKAWYKIEEVMKLQRRKFVDALDPGKEYETKRLVKLIGTPQGIKLNGAMVKVQGLFVMGMTMDEVSNWGIRITHLEAAPCLEEYDGQRPSIQIGLNMGYDPSPDFPDDHRVKYKMRTASWKHLTATPDDPEGTIGAVYVDNPAIEYEPPNRYSQNTYYKSWREYGNSFDTGSQMNLDVINPIFPMQIGVRENPRANISSPVVPVDIISGCGAKPMMPPVIGPFTGYQTPAQVKNNFKMIAILYNDNYNNDDMFLTIDFEAYANNPGGFGFYITDDDVTATFEREV